MRAIGDVRNMLGEIDRILTAEFDRLSKSWKAHRTGGLPGDWRESKVLSAMRQQLVDLKLLRSQLQRPLQTARALDWLERDAAGELQKPQEEQAICELEAAKNMLANLEPHPKRVEVQNVEHLRGGGVACTTLSWPEEMLEESDRQVLLTFVSDTSSPAATKTTVREERGVE